MLTKGSRKAARRTLSERDRPDARIRDEVNGVVAAALRWTRMGGPAWRLGRHSAKRLPWYLVIGDAGSGKSTMLEAAGLRREDGASCSGKSSHEPAVLGWFGNDAVLFETTIGDWAREEARHMAIRALKRARRGCPVNGIVVVVAAQWLMDAQAEGRAERFAAWRECVDQCYRQWQRRVPVYVIVTQCDHVTGFDAFAADLTDEARARPLGLRFPLDSELPGGSLQAHFEHAFEALTNEAHAQVLARMPVHADAARAAMTLAFPTAWKALAPALADFIREVFDASPRHPEIALLRTVHFSAWLGKAPRSEYQESAPLPSAQGAARACFVRGWLGESLLRERDLVRSRCAMPRRRVVQLRLVAAACAVLVICAALGGVQTYRHESAAIAASSPMATALAQAGQAGIDLQSPRAMLTVLDRARALPCGEGGPSFGAHLILDLPFVGEPHLRAACRAAYRTVLRETIEPYVAARMARSLRDPSETPSMRFGTLRAYLMLGDKRRFDRDALLAWIERDRSITDLSAAQRAAWLAHCVAWADPSIFASDVPLDAKLIAETRANLREQPAANRLFDAVMPALRAAMPDPLTVADMAGPAAALAFYRKSGARLADGVPGAFTLAGMRRYYGLRDKAIAQAQRDDWVLGEPNADATRPSPRRQPAQVDALATELDRLYFTAYSEAWDALIGDVGLRPVSHSDDGSALVSLLAGRESPLRAFLARAAQETTTNAGAGSPAEQRASGPVHAVVRKIAEWFGRKGTDAPAVHVAHVAAASPSLAQALVDRHFDALHRLVNADGTGNASALDAIQAQLKEVAVYLRAADVARASGLPAPADEALDRLRQSAVAMPAPLGDMLGTLARRGASEAQSTRRASIDAVWRADSAGFCRAATTNRYPFFPDGADDVTPDDFTRLFAAGGLLDVFFESYLKPYVDMSTVPWRWRARVAPPGMSVAALREFERAARIREAFFSDHGKTLDVRFTLTPRGMDPGLTRFVLASAGRTVDYAHDPPRATTFEWPDPAGAHASRVDFSPASADGRHGMEKQGPWSLFRLLDEGRLDARSADRFGLIFSLEGRSVALDLAASSVVNPFSLPALRAFRCPSGF